MPHPGRASAYVGAGASLSGASLWHDRIMKRWLGMVALLVAAAGVLVMMLPTMELRWGAAPELGLDPPVTRHSWFDPLLPGVARFDAPLALLAGIAGSFLLVVSLRKGSPSWLPVGLLVAAAVVPLLGCWAYGSLGWSALWAPIAMAASATVAAIRHRLIRASVTSIETHVHSEP